MSGDRRAVSLGLAIVAGALFGAGLVISGMTLPTRVIGFLDVGGAWDPTLMFVMGGAVVAYGILLRLIVRRGHPVLDTRFHLPTRRDVDSPLIVGSALFGVGWGIGGFCPGPGLAAAGTGTTSALVFVAAMLAGMLLQHATARPRG